MTNVIEGPNGETCTDHGMPWIRFPLNPNTGPFIPVLLGGSDPLYETVVSHDMALTFAQMQAKERKAALAALIQTSADTRNIAVSKKQVTKAAEEVADQLDAERIQQATRGIWPPDKIDLKFDYKGGKISAGITLTWKFPR